MDVTSTEFQQNVGRWQDVAQHKPVTITKNGRAHTVLMSAVLYEAALKGRVVQLVENLDDDTLNAISKAKVPPQFDHLNELMS